MEKKPHRIRINKEMLDRGYTDIFIIEEGEGMCCEGDIEISQGYYDDRNTIRFRKSELKSLIKLLQTEIPKLTGTNQKSFMREKEVYLMKKGSFDTYMPGFFGLDNDFKPLQKKHS